MLGEEIPGNEISMVCDARLDSRMRVDKYFVSLDDRTMSYDVIANLAGPRVNSYDAYVIVAFVDRRMYIIKSFDQAREEVPKKPEKVIAYYGDGVVRELQLRRDG